MGSEGQADQPQLQVQPHVVIFPYMAQGHTLPLLDLSKVFARRGLKVSIITTPANASSIRTYISCKKSNSNINIHVIEIPFPRPLDLPIPIPEGVENTSQLTSMELLFSFLVATTHLQGPFHRLLQDMSDAGSLPVCVISDFFLGWTLDTCHAFGIPRIVFHGMSVLSIAIGRITWLHSPHLTATSDSEPLHLPGLKEPLPYTLTTADLPESIRIPNHDDPFSRFITEVGQKDMESWGVIVNSFMELEQAHVDSLESLYVHPNAKAWCVGPLLLYHEKEDEEWEEDVAAAKANNKCTKWLSEQAMSSVIYVSFGTQAEVSDSQLDEVGHGLEMSECPFLWVVRSSTWTPPEGMEERLKGRGLVVRKEWVDQRGILGHPATGGFLSHCGWNSVLESFSMGVPILAWPMMAEQSLNAKLVVEGLNAGISVVDIEKKRMDDNEHFPSTVPVLGDSNPANNTKFIGWNSICQGVKELMRMGTGGEKAGMVRERAEALGRAANGAVQQGGCSYETVSQLIHKLCSDHTAVITPNGNSTNKA